MDLKQIYKEKEIDVGFIILDLYSESNKTINCIRSYFADSTCVLVLSKKQKSDYKNIVYAQDDEKLSFFNAAIKKPPSKNWNFFIFGGTIVKPSVLGKLSCFVENYKNVLFPVLDRKTKFLQSSLNGLLIHKKALQEIGSFSKKYKHDSSKLLWYATAVEKGYDFRAIVGARLIHK